MFFYLLLIDVTGYHESLHVIRVVTLMCVIIYNVDNVFVSDQVIFNHEQSVPRVQRVPQSWYDCTLRFGESHNYRTSVLTLCSSTARPTAFMRMI